MKRRPMFSLWAASMAAWLIVSILDESGSLASYFTVFVILSIFLGVLTLILLIKAEVARVFWLIPAFFIVFFIRFSIYQFNINKCLEYSDKIIEQINNGAYGRVYKTEFKNDNSYVYIDAENLEGNNLGRVLLLISGECEIEESMLIYFEGKASRFSEPTNPGQFNSKKYYESKGVTFRVIDPTIKIIKENNLFWKYLKKIKSKIKQSIEMTAGDNAGIYEAMLLGEKNDLSEDVKNIYQSAGISHILAISGLHVSFIGMLIFSLLRGMGIGRPAASAIAGVIIILYSFMTGNSVSAIRASVMLILSLGAGISGRTYDILSSMAFAWCLTIFIYPGQVAQAGFQLSFGAIIAFAFISPEISQLQYYLKKKKKGRKSYIKRKLISLETAIYGSLAVAAVTWPVIAWHMYVINPLSIFINLIIVPLMSLVMADIMIASLAGICGIYGLLPMKFCNLVWLPGNFILEFYKWICEKCSLGIGQFVTGQPLLWQIITYYMILVGLIIIIHIINSVLEKKKNFCEYRLNNWNDVRPKMKVFIRSLLIPILTTLQLVSLFLLHRPNSDNTLIVLDVGQGDGILYLNNNLCLAIDGGSSFIKGIGNYRIEPAITYYGYSTVTWAVTHPDTDHISGMLEILNDKSSPLTVKNIYVPKAAYGEDWEKIREAADNIKTLSTGDCLLIGESKMIILYPSVEDDGNSNELCFVMKLETKGKSVMLCGDIDLEVERKLVEKYGNELNADILKVAHHGSKYGSSLEFLNCVTPEISLISVGKNNYGHPAAETLERLKTVSIVKTTLDNGAIVLSLE